MKGKRQIKKENNKKLYIIIAIIVIVIATICIININKKKQSTNDNLNNSNDGIALYNTTLGEYVKQTEDGIKLNTSDLVNSDKILGNLTITDIQLTYNSGITSLTAKVINNSDTETGISTITATLIDKDENEICKVKGVIRALGIGETGKLNISMSGNFITAYDIKFQNWVVPRIKIRPMFIGRIFVIKQISKILTIMRLYRQDEIVEKANKALMYKKWE